MPTRMIELRQAVRGLNCSGIPLVAFDGHRFGPAGYPDDPGLFLLVPVIAVRLRLALATALDLTLLLAILVATVIDYAGYWRLFAGTWARLVCAVVFVALAALQITGGDVYVFQSAPVIAASPWLIGYAVHQDRSRLAVTCVLFALGAGCCALVRSSALVPCAAFLTLLVLGSYRASRVVILLPLLRGSESLPDSAHASGDQAKRRFPGSPTRCLQRAMNRHVFWHSAYIGLGVLAE